MNEPTTPIIKCATYIRRYCDTCAVRTEVEHEDTYERAVRIHAAERASTPPDALTVLASDEDERVREAVAGNPSTPPEALAKLANDRYAKVRIAVACTSRTPPEALVMLAGDTYAEVRRVVAGNGAAPPEALTALASDEDERVCTAVASWRRDLQPEVQAILARSTSQRVLSALAANPAVAIEVRMAAQLRATTRP